MKSIVCVLSRQSGFRQEDGEAGYRLVCFQQSCCYRGGNGKRWERLSVRQQQVKRNEAEKKNKQVRNLVLTEREGFSKEVRLSLR